MRIQWSGEAKVAVPANEVYAYLANFLKHSERPRSLLSIERIADGENRGVGARYLAYEKIEFPTSGWRRVFNRKTVGRAQSEVLELVPNKRIRWHAQRCPGSAPAPSSRLIWSRAAVAPRSRSRSTSNAPGPCLLRCG
jgi:hypothetical protein